MNNNRFASLLFLHNRVDFFIAAPNAAPVPAAGFSQCRPRILNA